MYVWRVRLVKESTLIKKWKRKLKISAKVVAMSTRQMGLVIVAVSKSKTMNKVLVIIIGFLIVVGVG